MSGHLMPITTHTVELDQLAEINRTLAERRRRSVSAEELEIADARLLGDGHVAAPQRTARDTLPGYAVLQHVEADGSTEWPYVYGHFTGAPWRPGDLVVELHEQTLSILSRRLGLHHRWND
jgi:hypothetical protein